MSKLAHEIETFRKEAAEREVTCLYNAIENASMYDVKVFDLMQMFFANESWHARNLAPFLAGPVPVAEQKQHLQRLKDGSKGRPRRGWSKLPGRCGLPVSSATRSWTCLIRRSVPTLRTAMTTMTKRKMTTAHHNHRRRSIMSEPIHPVPSQPKPQPAQECESLHAASVEYALDGFRMNAIQLLSLNVPLSASSTRWSNAVASQEMYDEDRQVPKQKSRARWEELCEDLSQIAQSHLIHAAKTLKKNCQFSNSTIVELVERNLLTQTDWDKAHRKAGKTKAGGQR
jgi:hypothetical protein